MTTDNTHTPTVTPEETRRKIQERMILIERTLHNLNTPGVLSREDQLATYRELNVDSRSAASGRLRTEWLRLKTYLENFDERYEAEAKNAS